MSTKANALISVSDKTGLVTFARTLISHGIRIYSTGGTEQTLREAGIEVDSISQLTGFHEIFGGRVKTLHPKIFGGILARRQNTSDAAEATAHNIPFFDYVVVNLYPFAETISRPNVTHEQAIENIDIGGVSLIRAAAKNYTDVAVITSPQQYAPVADELSKQDGRLTLETRLSLARAAFLHTAQYDLRIYNYLVSLDETAERSFPEVLPVLLEKASVLRYGENPHQAAALYRLAGANGPSLVNARQLQGKALSYNNIMDADTAFLLVKEFSRPTIAILKHANPCGVASADHLVDAYHGALETDPVSAFGGIIGANREIDEATAQAITGTFTEVIIAPAYSRGAREILAKKKNLRLLEIDRFGDSPAQEYDFKAVSGGILLQDKDLHHDDDTTFRVVTRRAPTESEWQSLRFAWKVVKWVKSNAIVFALGERTLGIGAGQMSRVDASRFAIMKSQTAGLSLAGSVVASDAFFPFADGVEAAVEAGATALIQPGGSVRDQDVIDAADRHNAAMVFTGIRHFRH